MIFGQVQPCSQIKLSYNLNQEKRINVSDTLGDLILKSNKDGAVYKSAHNIFFSNKNLYKLTFWVKGINTYCYFNDSILIVEPNAPELIFYYFDGKDTIAKSKKVKLFSKPEYTVLFDNQYVESEGEIQKFKSVDSLMFKFIPYEFQKYFAFEDFDYKVQDLRLSIIRNRTLVAYENFKDGRSFSLKKLWKEAEKGDRLVFTYLFIVENSNGKILSRYCHGLNGFTLGEK